MHIQKGLPLGTTPAQTINYTYSKTAVTFLTEHNLFGKTGSFAKDVCVGPKHTCFLNEKKKKFTLTVLQISKLTFNKKKNALLFFTTTVFQTLQAFSSALHPPLAHQVQPYSLASGSFIPPPPRASGTRTCHQAMCSCAEQNSLSPFTSCQWKLQKPLPAPSVNL